MRTLVDIGEAELTALNCMAKDENVSRASLIRRAIGDFLKSSANRQQADAFGLWKNSDVDGVAYQEALREEW